METYEQLEQEAERLSSLLDDEVDKIGFIGAALIMSEEATCGLLIEEFDMRAAGQMLMDIKDRIYSISELLGDGVAREEHRQAHMDAEKEETHGE